MVHGMADTCRNDRSTKPTGRNSSRVRVAKGMERVRNQNPPTCYSGHHSSKFRAGFVLAGGIRRVKFEYTPVPHIKVFEPPKSYLR